MAENLEGFYPGIEDKDLKDGTMKMLSIEGTPILFIRQKGKIFVFDNRCPHQNCGLSGGKLDGLCLFCPCHDWCFDLETGEYKEEPFYKLKTFEWKIHEGKIWVKLDDF